MPYKSEKIKIEGTQHDRSRKLTEDQKAYIHWLREEEGLSQRQLAAMFGVSRRLITFVLDPEKEKQNKALQKQHRLEGRYKNTKEQWAEVQREHRRYKQQLHKDGLI